MDVYFSTVVRAAPVQAGGAVHRLDWDAKRALKRVPIVPSDPDIIDPNPRGNSRGGRGIAVLGERVVVASYHTLYLFDHNLNLESRFSHGLMVGMHEVAGLDGNRLLVASTAIDAALEIELEPARVVGHQWPREMEELQAIFNLKPMSIDKGADNRTKFLGKKHGRHPSHLHMNALRMWEERVLALFHRPGAIVDLTARRVLVQDDELKGAHNLLIDNGLATVNDTKGKTVRTYDLRSGAMVRCIDLQKDAYVRELAAKVPPEPAAAPLFVRGLDRVGGHLFVGLSPATILMVDEKSGDVVDAYAHSEDVRVCIHGLAVV